MLLITAIIEVILGSILAYKTYEYIGIVEWIKPLIVLSTLSIILLYVSAVVSIYLYKISHKEGCD